MIGPSEDGLDRGPTGQMWKTKGHPASAPSRFCPVPITLLFARLSCLLLTDKLEISQQPAPW